MKNLTEILTARRTCTLCQAIEWVTPIDAVGVGQCPVCECSFIPDEIEIDSMTEPQMNELIPRLCD